MVVIECRRPSTVETVLEADEPSPDVPEGEFGLDEMWDLLGDDGTGDEDTDMDDDDNDGDAADALELGA